MFVAASMHGIVPILITNVVPLPPLPWFFLTQSQRGPHSPQLQAPAPGPNIGLLESCVMEFRSGCCVFHSIPLAASYLALRLFWGALKLCIPVNPS